MRPNSSIFVGGHSCEITETGTDFIVVKCKNDFVMVDKMKISLPGVTIDIPTITDRDQHDINEFAIKGSVNFIAVSSVRKAMDIEFVRNMLGPKTLGTKIIAKIENHEGLSNFDEILAEADGIMICRSDLSLEIPAEKVYIAQKWMIEKANLAAKPVMIASQMFESMIKSARPTRQEASDISNAVLDGVDACILHSETVIGDYPINAVSMLGKCCVEAEKTIDYRKAYNNLKIYSPAPFGTAESVSCAAVAAVLDLQVDLIIVLTDSGQLARQVSKFRPEVPIICCSPSMDVVQSMNAQRGIWGVISKGDLGIDDQIHHSINQGRKLKVCKIGSKVAVIHGSNEDTPEECNTMKIMTVE